MQTTTLFLLPGIFLFRKESKGKKRNIHLDPDTSSGQDIADSLRRFPQLTRLSYFCRDRSPSSGVAERWVASMAIHHVMRREAKKLKIKNGNSKFKNPKKSKKGRKKNHAGDLAIPNKSSAWLFPRFQDSWTFLSSLRRKKPVSPWGITVCSSSAPLTPSQVVRAQWVFLPLYYFWGVIF